MGASESLIGGSATMKRTPVLKEHGEAARSECPRRSFQQGNRTANRTVLLRFNDARRRRPARGVKTVTPNRGFLPRLSEVTEGIADELGLQGGNTVIGDSEPKASGAQGPTTYSRESTLETAQT